ncbi:MAG: N-acetylmuramoyl-L-alanine amidase [Candidatus Obscuribacterales bacterium]|jgi:N-acetylmuramoyl-L-alanine amidase
MTSATKATVTFMATMATLSVSSCANAQVSDNTNESFSSTTISTKPVVKKYQRPVLDASKPLLLVYPNTSGTATIAASSSFLIGSTYPNYALTVNEQKVATNKQGFFAHVIPLDKGINKFTIKVFAADGSQAYTQVVEILREKARASLSPSGFEFAKNSFEPKEDRGLNVGELIEFSVRATPGSQVQVLLGKKQLALASIASLKTRKAGTPINRGIEAAYGQVFQRHPAASPDLYVGLYRIEAGDQLYLEHPRFVLQKAGKSLTVASPATITVLRQPQIAHTIHKDTITRVAPDLARLTPLPEGVRLIVDGYQGENIRCRYAANKHVWIKKEDLSLGDNSGPAPDSVARTIQVKEDRYGEIVVIPLNQRLPFLIEQNLKTNHLNVKIYGVIADTDWVYQAPESGDSKLIENVSWKQPEDGVYQVDVDLTGQRQWGYFADFDDNNLNLHIKYPPAIKPILAESTTPQPRLQGLSVCVDPGHGGKETGAIGPSAIREAEMNLAIALKFRDLLVAEGATVFMTREDDVDVSLNDRVDFAKAKNVDLLISIHNNALPDGRDPNKEHGTSSYWYHPQSQELAASLKNAEANTLGFPDIGARYQNLALCRPTNMPAVLVEVGFVCNPDEYAKLISPASQQAAAQGMLKGLLNYFAKK